MITHWKTTILAIALLFSVASVLVLSSCGGDDEPEPEPIIPPGLSYTAATVAVGSTGTLTPAVQGDAATYSITDDGDAGFVTIDASTGVLSVAAESTTGVYTVAVKATNSAGSADATVDITIGVNNDFDPTGKSYVWKYFINQTADVTFLNLDALVDGVPAELPLAVDWPANWPDVSGLTQELLLQYFALTSVEHLLFQVPGDDVCGALNPEEGGDTLLVIVNSDLTLSTVCHVNDAAGTTVEIGTSIISYSDDMFHWALSMSFQGIPLTYIISDPQVADFIDPLDPSPLAPSGTPRQFSSLQGTVENFTTPTNFLDEASILTSLTQIKVDVVLEILP